jgi:hypothetical protein
MQRREHPIVVKAHQSGLPRHGHPSFRHRLKVSNVSASPPPSTDLRPRPPLLGHHLHEGRQHRANQTREKRDHQLRLHLLHLAQDRDGGHLDGRHSICWGPVRRTQLTLQTETLPATPAPSRDTCCGVGVSDFRIWLYEGARRIRDVTTRGFGPSFPTWKRRSHPTFQTAEKFSERGGRSSEGGGDPTLSASAKSMLARREPFLLERACHARAK